MNLFVAIFLEPRKAAPLRIVVFLKTAGYSRMAARHAASGRLSYAGRAGGARCGASSAGADAEQVSQLPLQLGQRDG
jgi:hypothetical protein